MSDEDKAAYEMKATKDKERYEIEMRAKHVFNPFHVVHIRMLTWAIDRATRR